jgi:sterol desaturase/sphingolipid hydroxylase (fatty acid hydroxylase superfamily)
MEEAVFIHSNLIVLALVGWFVLLALAELLFAGGRREPVNDRRLVTNFGLALIILFAGSMVPLAKLSASAVGRSLGIGLAHVVTLPWPAVLAAAVIVESLASYWAHRLMHRAPLLWRIHRVHHSDDAVDVSTSYRNHPFELLVTMPVSAAVVLVLGTPATVVLATQTLLTAATLWQHADIALPDRLERALGWIMVTPRLHRLHHDRERATHDSNYGELLIVWDRLYGTFNGAEGRRRVGLDDQVAPPDGLLQQIWSPIYAA